MTNDDLVRVITQHRDLASRVATLERHYAELHNELSLLTSLQRTCFDMETRIAKLEGGKPEEKRSRAVKATQLPFAPFGSMQALVAQIESTFDCRNGDYRSHHTVWVAGPQFVGYRSYPYVILALIAPTDMQGAQERLRQALWIAFVKLKQTCTSERPVLYWRYAEAERIEETSGLLTREGAACKIRTRVAIPEADFKVVSEVVTPDGDPAAVLRE